MPSQYYYPHQVSKATGAPATKAINKKAHQKRRQEMTEELHGTTKAIDKKAHQKRRQDMTEAQQEEDKEETDEEKEDKVWPAGEKGRRPNNPLMSKLMQKCKTTNHVANRLRDLCPIIRTRI